LVKSKTPRDNAKDLLKVFEEITLVSTRLTAQLEILPQLLEAFDETAETIAHLEVLLGKTGRKRLDPKSDVGLIKRDLSRLKTDLGVLDTRIQSQLTG